MASPDLAVRLQYLQSSAYLLSTSAPSTSRYLLQSHNALQFTHSLAPPRNAQKSQVCQACGTIFHKPDSDTQSPLISIEQQRQRRKKGKSKSGKREVKARAMVYNCRVCSRQTRFALDVKPPRRCISTGAKEKAPIASLPSTSSNPQPSSSSSATGGPAPKPKRQRNPSKPKSGLSALLQRAKAAESSSSAGGFGLDLMDLMKKS